MVGLSIIVPVYNVERYLRRCIDSILKQTFRDFEVILINDGSTDNSRTICNEYKRLDTRINIINQKNGGLSSARNEGLKKANGEYIAFVDSDDYISNNMFMKMMKLANEYNCDIVSCGYRRFEGKFCTNEESSEQIFKFSNREALNNYLLNYDDKDRKMDTVVWNKIYRRTLFNNIEFPEGKIYEDGYVTYKLLYKANNIIHIDDELYYYFQKSDSISNSKFSERDVKSYDDWRDIFRYIYIYEKSLSHLAGNKYIKKNIDIYIKLCKLKNEFNNVEEYKKNIKRDLIEDFDKLNSLQIDYDLRKELKLFKYNYKLVLASRSIDSIRSKFKVFIR